MKVWEREGGGREPENESVVRGYELFLHASGLLVSIWQKFAAAYRSALGLSHSFLFEALFFFSLSLSLSLSPSPWCGEQAGIVYSLRSILTRLLFFPRKREKTQIQASY